ncbi:MAG: hypothetical protein JKY94_16905 [Rhodobacteraceae bacterium]|nr:hypothetical protein [Paracoccaceae bacterium]
MKIDLNARVGFTLTPSGVELWKQHWTRLGLLGLPEKFSKGKEIPKSLQLWEAMQIFGPGCLMGADPAFADNVITIEDTPTAVEASEARDDVFSTANHVLALFQEPPEDPDLAEALGMLQDALCEIQ